MSDKELLALAQTMLDKAYVPYSHFPVGAALLCDDGAFYLGCNIEGASYGNTICAERTALCKAVSDGKRAFKMLAVCANTDDYCTPCGICRQMLYEFAPDLRVICANKKGEFETRTLKELLPYAFSAKDL